MRDPEPEPEPEPEVIFKNPAVAESSSTEADNANKTVGRRPSNASITSNESLGSLFEE